MHRHFFSPFVAALAVAGFATFSALPAHAADVALPTGQQGATCVGVCGTSGADGDIGLSPLGKPVYGYVTTSGSTARGVSPLALDGNKTGIATNGSSFLTGVFSAAAGDRISMHFNYVSTDGKGFDDYAWARVVDAADNSLVAWLFTARSTNSGTRNIVPGNVLDRSEFDPDLHIVGYDDWDFVSKDAANPVDWSKLGASNGSCWEENAKGCGYTGWLESTHSFASAGSYRVQVGVVNWGDEAFDSGLAFDYAGLSAAAVPPLPVPEPGTFALMSSALAALAWRRRRSAPPKR
jgi:PEP-CTERM motif